MGNETDRGSDIEEVVIGLDMARETIKDTNGGVVMGSGDGTVT